MFNENMDKNMEKMISLLKDSRVTLPPDFSQKLHNRLVEANQEMLQNTASKKTWLQKLVSSRGILGGAVCALVISTVFITGFFDRADIIPSRPNDRPTNITNDTRLNDCPPDYPYCFSDTPDYGYNYVNGYTRTGEVNAYNDTGVIDGDEIQALGVVVGGLGNVSPPSGTPANNMEQPEVPVQESIIIPMPNDANPVVLIPPIRGGVRLPTPREFPAAVAGPGGPTHDIIAPMSPRYSATAGAGDVATAPPADGIVAAVVVGASADAFLDDLLEIEPMSGPIDFGEEVIFINAIRVYRLCREEAAVIFEILGITGHTNQVTINQEDFDRLPRSLMERNFAGTLESRDSVFHGIMHRIEIIGDCAN